MESIIRKSIYTILCLSTVIFVSCGGDGTNPPQAIDKEKATEKHEDEKLGQLQPTNGAILFIDKSASLQKLAPEEALKAGEQIFNKLKTFLGDSGGEVTIYFIHKDLASASPYINLNCVMPDLKGLTSIPAAKAEKKYKVKVDSLIHTINQAINTPASQPTSQETDLWITLKKAEDKFAHLPQNGQRLLIYYSDMVESVNKSSCGKDYERIKFKDVPDAVTLGKKDVTPIKACYGIDKFSGSTEVFLCFPVGALQTSKHPYMFDYWKALFSEFKADKISSNL